MWSQHTLPADLFWTPPALFSNYWYLLVLPLHKLLKDRPATNVFNTHYLDTTFQLFFCITIQSSILCKQASKYVFGLLLWNLPQVSINNDPRTTDWFLGSH